MSKNSQRQAKQARKKELKRRKERMRERKQATQALQNRLEVRLERQVPRAWPDELVQDVAIFDDAALATLSEEDAAHAKMLRAALAEVGQQVFGEALESLKDIPRRSPYADWRVFVRGLQSWQEGNFPEAEEAWARLEKERRPWRMAASMMLALREDLAELKQNASRRRSKAQPSDEQNSASEQSMWLDGCDEKLFDHAKLVRQTQVDRVALRAARGILAIRKEVKDSTIEPSHIKWLKDFTNRYRSIEPDLVQSLHEAAIQQAINGPYYDMVMRCFTTFRGPRHDRTNQLAAYFVEVSANEGRASEESTTLLNAYLADLYKNEELTKTVRGAIASCLHYQLATQEASKGCESGWFAMFSPKADQRFVEKEFKNALKAYPANRKAYEGYESWIEELIDVEDKVDPRRKLESRLADLRIDWLKKVPNDIDTRLKLVDYLLESERTEDAKVHVQFLAGTRRDNPLADAMQWKWSLLESMRLARRKASLNAARENLNAAEQAWPTWLSKDWLPYLKAAIEVRDGKPDAFDNLPAEVRSPSPLADACMRLAAAQRMSVATADLKPMRNLVDTFVKDVDSLPYEVLMPAIVFFWDLHRTRNKYPAYRMHGSKFLNRLLSLIEQKPELYFDRLDSVETRAALFLLANEAKFQVSFVDLLGGREQVGSHATLTAAVVTYFNRERYDVYAPMIETLNKAIETEPDPFYRHAYRAAIERSEQVARERKDWGSMFSRFERTFGGAIDEMDDGDEEDDWDDDDLCDCIDCRRARGEVV